MPKFIRSTYAIKRRRKQKKEYYAVTRETATNQDQQWTYADECKVLDHAIPDRELGRLIGRSVQAIQVHRVKLKKLNPERSAVPSTSSDTGTGTTITMDMIQSEIRRLK